jgi:hypothetical protein
MRHRHEPDLWPRAEAYVICQEASRYGAERDNDHEAAGGRSPEFLSDAV